MTDPTLDDTSSQPFHHANTSRRLRFPRIDFVTVLLALLAAIILLSLTAELWLPHANG